MRSLRPRPLAFFALSFVLLAGCGGDALDEELEHSPIADDAEIADDADVPLLAPNTGFEDAEVIDTATAEAPSDVGGDDEARSTAPSDTGGTSLVDAGVPSPDVRAPPPPPPPPPPPRCTGSASGQSNIFTCTTDRRARQRCVNGAVQTEPCPHGCVPRPSGTNDTCAPPPPPPPPDRLPVCAHRALLRWGLHPDASDHLRCAGVPAERITQTIGNAAASAGTHGQDGRAGGAPYSAATDISTRGLSNADIRALLSRLADQGFAAWYRWPGHDGWPSSEAPHIHAIYVGCVMKSSLRAQVRDWLVGRNGLTSHSTYSFFRWSNAQQSVIRAVFIRHN